MKAVLKKSVCINNSVIKNITLNYFFFFFGLVVGSEEAVGGIEETNQEDGDIPLPTDQDEYTAARPYPCDFCSRRFRKKANLMNHMVAHQTDRPHGCNLCGVRYVMTLYYPVTRIL